MIAGTDKNRVLEIMDEPVFEQERYASLVNALPRGDFYLRGGVIVPRRSGTYTFKFTATDAPNRNFDVIIAGVQTRTILTDGSGEVLFFDRLSSGSSNIEMRIVDNVDGRTLIAYLTVVNYGTWDAAIAAVMDDVDADIENVKSDTFLDKVDSADIEQKFGRKIGTPQAPGWNLNTYAELLNELFQAYDVFSAVEDGLLRVISAITQVPPTTYRRDTFGPRWVLGFQYLRNNEFALDTDSDGIPDDWVIDGTSATMLIDIAGVGLTNLFGNQRLQVTATGVGNAAVFSLALPLFREYLGYEWTFSAWVESAGVFNIVVGISDDGGATWIESAPLATTTSPRFLSVKKFISAAATSLRVRVRQVGSIIGDVWFIERVALFIAGVTGLYLGSATIPRSVRNSKLGRPLLWWSPDVLTSNELTITGLSNFIDIVNGASRNVGHKDLIVPAHVPVIDRDVTLRSVTTLTIDGVQIIYLYPGMSTGTTAALDWNTATDQLRWREHGEIGFGVAVTISANGLYVLKAVAGHDSVVVSVDFARLGPDASATDVVTVVDTLVGVIENADWLAGLTKVNLDIESRTPDRFSHLKPSLPSKYVENLNFSSITSQATLSYDSTQDQSKALLLEDGISVPSDKWSFINSTTVQITTLITTATYEFRYEVLMEFETSVLDLGASWQDLTWLFDAYVYERYEKMVELVSTEQELQFDRNTYQAPLRFRSDGDVETGQLVQILAGVQTTISANDWFYVDALTAQISGTVFNVNATYILTYNAEKLKPIRVPIVTFEIASSTDGIAFGSYASIDKGDLTDQKRYYKIKVFVVDALTIYDVKISSLVLKGMRIVNDSLGV